MAHWLDIGGTLGGMTHRHLFRRAADPDPEVSGPRHGQRDAGRHHPAECAAAEPRHGRPARAGDGGEDRRAALPASCSTATARDAVLGVDRRDHGSRRGDGARAHAHDPGRRLRGRILHGRRRHRHRQAGADQGAGHRQGRRDDGRPHRGVEAGARLLQFRHHHRLCLRAGRLQVPDLADRLSDQRRLVPQPQGHRAAGPRRQRDAAGADALVDDLSDDDHRHGLQGAGAGDPGSRHRRPSRRSAGVASCHGINPTHVGILHRQFRAARRRLGRQAQRGRRLRHGLHQRRRHPQQRRTSRPRRNSRWWSSATRWCRIPAAPAAIAAGSASSAWCARAPT